MVLLFLIEYQIEYSDYIYLKNKLIKVDIIGGIYLKNKLIKVDIIEVVLNLENFFFLSSNSNNNSSSSSSSKYLWQKIYI